jgi:hypothetical protein
MNKSESSFDAVGFGFALACVAALALVRACVVEGVMSGAACTLDVAAATDEEEIAATDSDVEGGGCTATRGGNSELAMPGVLGARLENAMTLPTTPATTTAAAPIQAPRRTGDERASPNVACVRVGCAISVLASADIVSASAASGSGIDGREISVAVVGTTPA